MTHKGLRNHSASSRRDRIQEVIATTKSGQHQGDAVRMDSMDQTIGIKAGDVVSGNGKGATRMEDILTMNRVASRVWELLDGFRTVDDIARIIASEFELTRSRALAETRGLIEMFGQTELVSVTR